MTNVPTGAWMSEGEKVKPPFEPTWTYILHDELIDVGTKEGSVR